MSSEATYLFGAVAVGLGATLFMDVWALLLDRLFAAGARLVMFDLTFGVPKEGDAEFRAALDRYHDRAVIGADFEFIVERDQGEQAKGVPPTTTLIPAPGFNDDRVGYVVLSGFPRPQDPLDSLHHY